MNVNTPGESSNRALLGESAGSVRGGVKARKSGNLKGKNSKRANTGEAESKESTRAKRTKVNRGYFSFSQIPLSFLLHKIFSVTT